MYMDVAFLTETEIEANAQELLDAYSRDQGTPSVVPIPVEDITEKFEGLTLDFTDLNVLFGGQDVLGALWVEDRAVYVDERLDPDEFPGTEGRCRFTVGHELGHWRQHRCYLCRDADQRSLFDDNGRPNVVCRAADEHTRIEIQANRFAAALLMPRPLVFSRWNDAFSSTEPLRWDATDAERDWVTSEFAQTFGVSRQAMGIRLRQLGLVETSPTLGRLS